MEDLRSLKATQLDALREVANIGAGHAATALSQMIGETIMISVPTINVSRLEEVPPQVAGAGRAGRRGAHAHARRPHRTHAARLSAPTAQRLASLLHAAADRRPRRGPTEFTEMEQSAIKEAGNILSSAYMNALSDFMGMMLLPSPPSLAVDMSDAVLTTTYLQFGTDKDYVFCVESEFLMNDRTEKLRGFFLLLPDPGVAAGDPQGGSRRVTVAGAHLRARPRSPAVVRPADRSVGRGCAQQPRRPVLQQGAVRGGGARVHEGARARPEDAGRAAQPRDRVLQHRLLRHAHSRAERARAPASGRPRRALGAGPHVRAARPAGRGGGRIPRAAAVSSRTTSARCSSSRWPRSSRATSSTAQQYLERALEFDPASSLLHFTLGEVLYHRGVNEEALPRARARDRAQSRESRRAVPDGLRARRHGAPRGGAGDHAARDPAESDAVARAGEPLDRASALDARRRRRRRRSRAASRRARASSRSTTSASRSAEGLLRRGAARIPGRRSIAAKIAISCCRRWPRCTCSCASRTTRWRCTTSCSSAQPQSPKLWNERGVALHQEGHVRRGRGELSERARGRADLRDRAQQPRRVALSPRRGRRRGGGVPRRARCAADVRQGAAQPRAAAQPRQSVSRSRSRRIVRCCRRDAENPVAWNGIGLVLSELRKFEDARNAFARAIQAKPDFAEAHYNMSFTLSNLGDFEGALRETKRALELDPYYVAQKFELAIDVEYEDPDLSIQPDLGGAERTGEGDDRRLQLRSAVARLAVHRSRAGRTAAERRRAAQSRIRRRIAMATDYLSKGLYDRAAAEVSRALSRGRDRAEGLALLGDIFAKQGLYGEALERYREALRIDPDLRDARVGEAWSLVRLGRGHEARPLAHMLVQEAAGGRRSADARRDGVRRSGRSGGGARRCSTRRAASRRCAPTCSRRWATSRARSATTTARSRRIVTRCSSTAISPSCASSSRACCRRRGRTREAEPELVAALDAVPTYAEATLELATLRRKPGRAREALHAAHRAARSATPTTSTR